MTDHARGRVVGWILIALAGLAIAVLLSVAASNLSTQPIGLSGEALKPGEKLAPVTVTRTEVVTRPVQKKPAHASPPASTPRTNEQHVRPEHGDDRYGNFDGDDD